MGESPNAGLTVKEPFSPQFSPEAESSRRPWWPWPLAAGTVLILGLALIPHRPRHQPAVGVHPVASPTQSLAFSAGRPPAAAGRLPRPRSASEAGRSAEEIVAAKVIQFGRSRRDIVRAIARRSQQEVPQVIEKFFDAVEAGNWEEIRTRWQELVKHSSQYGWSKDNWPDINPYWPAVLDAYGVAEQAHLWPAQQLLDYGNRILDSLSPGMVYVGGTDNGRWIPELLNETSGEEPHIILTQNALADGRYLDFLNTLYSGQMNTLTSGDSQRVFQQYTADAQKRLLHDQQFPDEPKQVLPGENITIDSNGKVNISGQVAVMAINEQLLQLLMQKNPGLSFGMQESFPMKGLYPDAVPLGPLMALNAGSADAFTPSLAAQSVDYWAATTQQLLDDPGTAATPDTLRAYSHDVSAAANLLAAHNFNNEAEQTYRLASQLAPYNIEAVDGLARVLAGTGRASEARQLLDQFAQTYPNLRSQVDSARATITWQVPQPQSPTR